MLNNASGLEGGIDGPEILEDYDGFFIPADRILQMDLEHLKHLKQIVYSYREFDIEKNKWSEYQSN